MDTTLGLFEKTINTLAITKNKERDLTRLIRDYISTITQGSLQDLKKPEREFMKEYEMIENRYLDEYRKNF